MSNPIVSLIVRLVDQLSGAPTQRLVNANRNIANSMGRVSAATVLANRRLTQQRQEAIATAGSATLASGGLARLARNISRAFVGSVRKAADFNDELDHIQVTGQATAEQIDAIKRAALNLAAVTGRKPGTLVREVAGELVAAGLAPETIVKMMEPIAKTAVATKAALKDVSSVGLGLIQNLEIPVEQLGESFDRLWALAKKGNYEFKDMAQNFRPVAAVAAAQGMKGPKALLELGAALEVVREGVGQPAQASQYLQDLLHKTRSQETVRNFEKVGVDINKAIADGAKAGRSPLESVVLAAREALAKNPGLTVAQLFHDRQASLAIGQLIEKYDKWIALQKEAAGAAGTVERDFQKMSSNTKNGFQKLAASIEAIQLTFGDFFDEPAKALARALMRMSEGVRSFMKEYPNLSRWLAYGAAGILIALAAFSALASALVGLAGAIALMRIAGGGAIIGAFLGRMLTPLRLLAGLLLLPVRLIALLARGLLVGLGVIGAIVGGFFSGFGGAILVGLRAALATVGLAALLRGLLLRLLGVLLGPVGWALLAAELAWTFREELMKAFNQGWEWLKEVGPKILQALTDGLSSIATSLSDIGGKIMDGLLQGLQAAAGKVLGWVSGFIGKLKSIFSFSIVPSIGAPNGGAPRYAPGVGPGGYQEPFAIPQRYEAPAGGAPGARQASVTYHNTFNIRSTNPKGSAQEVLAAIHRRRSGGFDEVLA